MVWVSIRSAGEAPAAACVGTQAPQLLAAPSVPRAQWVLQVGGRHGVPLHMCHV